MHKNKERKGGAGRYIRKYNTTNSNNNKKLP